VDATDPFITRALDGAVTGLHQKAPSCPDSVNPNACVFCDIVANRAPQERVWESEDAIAIRPRPAPINDGHLLIIPRVHVADARKDPALFGRMAAWAAYLSVSSRQDCNIYTSCGADASQTIMHMHVHLVPRFAGDGIALASTHDLD
jgi:histidine triad (HIT) family protein